MIQSFVQTLSADRELPHGFAPADAFEQLYRRREDPWDVRHSPFTRDRYLEVMRTLTAFAPCRSMLDVGCGEGTFTQYLTGFAGDVVGIDISATAIARARRGVPRARFHETSLEAFEPAVPFDVVVAIEMLYYAPSVTAALDKLRRLATHVVISYTHRDRARLDPELDRYSVPIARTFHPYFGTKRFGFVIATLPGAPAAPEVTAQE
ncbi:MAG: class I SAM-dependent methyltransferase [Cyanobacteria bacterium]|nr:class I SAM-dependent methyltransferase [Cyanobacteriota bacterium]